MAYFKYENNGLGRALTLIRSSQMITQRELAEGVGYSANYINNVENGIKNPSDKCIKNIAIFYGINWYDIHLIASHLDKDDYQDKLKNIRLTFLQTIQDEFINNDPN